MSFSTAVSRLSMSATVILSRSIDRRRSFKSKCASFELPWTSMWATAAISCVSPAIITALHLIPMRSLVVSSLLRIICPLLMQFDLWQPRRRQCLGRLLAVVAFEHLDCPLRGARYQPLRQPLGKFLHVVLHCYPLR